MLLSYVNTQLRDFYGTLEALCEDKGLDREESVSYTHLTLPTNREV